jgi:hypothetical protein
VSELGKLKYEIQHDRQLTYVSPLSSLWVSDVARPLIDDGLPDVAGYNAELEQQKGLTWLSATMMYSECYMYRSDALEQVISLAHDTGAYKTTSVHRSIGRATTSLRDRRQQG